MARVSCQGQVDVLSDSGDGARQGENVVDEISFLGAIGADWSGFVGPPAELVAPG
jgi:hypothetical protein